MIANSEIRSAGDAGIVRRGTGLNALFPRASVVLLAITGALIVATALECHSLSSEMGSLRSWALSLLYGALLWLWWAGVVELLWWAGERWPSALRVSITSVAAHLLVAVGIALIHLALLNVSVQWIANTGPEALREAYGELRFFDVGRFGIEFLMYGFLWSACVALNTQLAAQRDAMRSLELERQLSSAHLRALQMQLEPHFLFNTLNAVTSLIELDRSNEALATLGHLNTILRTVLTRNTPSKIPLAQELEMVESYLAIEQVRFADRVRIDINLDPNALDGLVPCFILQPIIENAIRHGIARCEGAGCIEASAKRNGTRMQLQVRDNGPGLKGSSHPGLGVGLINTRERLSHFYRDDYELRAHQPEAGGFEVSITIPYEKKVS